MGDLTRHPTLVENYSYQTLLLRNEVLTYGFGIFRTKQVSGFGFLGFSCSRLGLGLRGLGV